jgi:hypothetical protein
LSRHIFASSVWFNSSSPRAALHCAGVIYKNCPYKNYRRVLQDMLYKVHWKATASPTAPIRTPTATEYRASRGRAVGLGRNTCAFRCWSNPRCHASTKRPGVPPPLDWKALPAHWLQPDNSHLSSRGGAERSFRFAMRELELRTSRIRRNWLDRLRGYDRVYETRVTDGEQEAYGRGASREASEKAALRSWNNRFNDLDTREPE